MFTATPMVYSNFYSDVDVNWGKEHVKILNNGQELQLILEKPIAPMVYSNFYSDVDVNWGKEHVKILNNGQDLQLILEKPDGIVYAI
ncbi:hypothetical protein SUGI_0542320 [Cryptomeria japonica]|nr:hypothetical protein SUGI_0542320 [Cryptomeria japonica]